MTTDTAKPRMKMIPPLVFEFGIEAVRATSRLHLFEGDRSDPETRCVVCGKTFANKARGGSGQPHFALASHAKKHIRENEALDPYTEDQANASGWQGIRVMSKREAVEAWTAAQKAQRDRQPAVKELADRRKVVLGDARKLMDARESVERRLVEAARGGLVDVEGHIADGMRPLCHDIHRLSVRLAALARQLDEIDNEYPDDVRREAVNRS